MKPSLPGYLLCALPLLAGVVSTPAAVPLVPVTAPAPASAPRELLDLQQVAATNAPLAQAIAAARVEATGAVVRITPDGAVAEGGRHRAVFATHPAVELTLPDRQVLRWRPAFLAYHDTASGQSVLIAEVKDTAGEIQPGGRVLYAEAFDDVRASLRYTATRNSIEQDVLILEQLDGPQAWDLNPATTRLEVWTEFFDPPVPRASDTPDVIDFGSMKMVAGAAFALADEASGAGRRPVAKSWQKIAGRSFVIESLDYTAVQPLLDTLPKPAVKTAARKVQSERAALVRSWWGATAGRAVGNYRLAGQSSPTRNGSSRRQEAHASISQPSTLNSQRTLASAAVVLDFILVNTTPLPADAISWWPAGGNANDALGDQHGTPYGSLGYTGGKVGQAFAFDGTDDLVDVEDSAVLNPTNALTVEAWIYLPTDTAAHRTLVGKDDVTYYTDRQFLFTVTDTGRLRAQVGVDGNFYYLTGNATIQTGAWTHVAMTYEAEGGILAIYVNGVADTNGAVASPGALMATTQPLQIGGLGDPQAPAYLLTGSVDELTLYGRALGASEIQAIYDAGAAGKANPNCVSPATNLVAWWTADGNSYDFARTNHATLSGATYTGGQVAEGFTFDGLDDSVIAPHDALLNLNTNQDLTIEAWIRPLANTNDSGVMSLAGKRFGTNDQALGYELFLINGKLGFQIADAPLRSGNFANYLPYMADLRDGAWHHVAVSLDRDSATGCRLFVDGVRKCALSATTKAGSLTNAEPFRIGVHPQSNFNGWYRGGIDEVTVYRRALSDGEISAIYTAGCAGKCKLDTDGDGLSDLQESFWGTNPNDADTDDDGLTDGDEVFVQHTNPTVADTDGDGLSDGAEVLIHQSNPNSAATLDTTGTVNLNVYTPLK